MIAPSGKYSGDAKDYVSRFTSAVEYFPQWPETGKYWARGEMTSKGEEAGIAAITGAMVIDPTHHHGTNAFSSEEREAIAVALLSDTAYMKAARKHFCSAHSQ